MIRDMPAVGLLCALLSLAASAGCARRVPIARGQANPPASPPEAMIDSRANDYASPSQSPSPSTSPDFAWPSAPASASMAAAPSEPPSLPDTSVASYTTAPEPLTSIPVEPPQPAVAIESLPTLQAEPVAVTLAATTATTTTSATVSPARAERTVRITIDNVQVGLGPVRVAAFTDPTTFPSAGLSNLTMTLAPQAQRVTGQLTMNDDSMEQARRHGGSMAIAVYQDINNDGQLNRNRWGVPTEPFTFSRGAMGRRGPPAFEQAALPLDMNASDELAHIELSLRTQL